MIKKRYHLTTRQEGQGFKAREFTAKAARDKAAKAAVKDPTLSFVEVYDSTGAGGGFGFNILKGTR